MKRTILTLALACMLALGGGAFAELCTIDAVPAATLLIPQFKVDVSDDACANRTGVTTLFSINNASAAPQLAHVTLWTDQTVAVIDFDVYLTGYDVQTINLRDIFCDATLPQTGFAVSPVGPISDPNVAFASCNNSVTPGGGPNYDNPFSDNFRTLLKEWFTGRPSSLLGTCAGSGQLGDDIAVGYITIDNVNDCSLTFPDDPAYYSNGIIGNNNTLWGDYFVQDTANSSAQGYNAVHIEYGDSFMAGENTFYGRYEPGLGATNGREPLATTLATRFARAGGFDDTIVNVWREAAGPNTSYSCANSGPSWWPLDLSNSTGEGAVIAWNEAEDVCQIIPPPDGPSGDPTPTDDIEVLIPNEVNICTVGEENDCIIEVCGFNFGWLYMNLQASASVYGNDITSNFATTEFRSADGNYSVGLDAVQLDSACNPTVSNPGAP